MWNCTDNLNLIRVTQTCSTRQSHVFTIPQNYKRWNTFSLYTEKGGVKDFCCYFYVCYNCYTKCYNIITLQECKYTLVTSFPSKEYENLTLKCKNKVIRRMTSTHFTHKYLVRHRLGSQSCSDRMKL